MMTMRGRSFSYHKLKKLPHAAAGAGPHTTAAALEQADRQDQRQQPPSPSAIQESYRSYYRALARGRRQQQQQGGGGARRRRRPRLRISRLARALRRRAAAVGASVRASVARVARRLLHEGRPYIGDLFAGNYMFMQVAPSPITAATAPGDGKGGFADYYYATLAARSKAAAGVLYKV